MKIDITECIKEMHRKHNGCLSCEKCGLKLAKLMDTQKEEGKNQEQERIKKKYILIPKDYKVKLMGQWFRFKYNEDLKVHLLVKKEISK